MRLIDIAFSLVYLTAYIIFPFAMIILLIWRPCQMPLLGSLILPWNECSKPMLQSDPSFLVIRVLILIWEAILAYHHYLNAGHHAVHVLIAGILYLWEKSSSVFACPDTIKNNGFRKLQVLESILNSCIRRTLLPTVLIVCPSMQILTTFVFIKYNDTMSSSQMIFVSLFAVDTFVLNVLYSTGAGVIYRKSKVYLEGLRDQVKAKFEKRLLKSYVSLKVKFGTNFIDESTTLVIQHFCSTETANLLLLF